MIGDHARTLASVLDEIIPPSDGGTLPGAGALGVASQLTQVIELMPELELVIAPGLVAADEQAMARHGRSFPELSREEKLGVLKSLDATQPAFVSTLAFHAYIAYYQHPRVVSALGLEPRPPHPQGHAMAPNDPSLLDAVRKRPKLYREG